MLPIEGVLNSSISLSVHLPGEFGEETDTWTDKRFCDTSFMTFRMKLKIIPNCILSGQYFGDATEMYVTRYYR